MCPTVGALHRLNATCRCVEAGEDHLNHKAFCGARWVTKATAAQILALRLIEASPGILSREFAANRQSRGLSFRLFREAGWIAIARAKPHHPGRASVTSAGRVVLAELNSFDTAGAGLR